MRESNKPHFLSFNRQDRLKRKRQNVVFYKTICIVGLRFRPMVNDQNKHIFRKKTHFPQEFTF